MADAHSKASRLLGTVLSGRYRIDEVLSESETGALYRGEHAHMRKRIAVKVLTPRSAARPELLARFEREAIAGAHVDHPNVAAAKDFGVLEDGSSFFVIELLDGKTLRAILSEGPMRPQRAIHVGAQIARALDAAHGKGIVHRALSPDSVFLVERGGAQDVVKLVDFGLAKLPPELVGTTEDPDRAQRIATPVGAVATTLAYASPEFLSGNAIDGRADLYALGVLLCELVTGVVPARGVAPSLASRGAPPELDVLVAGLLAQDPAQRSASALEVAEALEALEVAPAPATKRAADPSSATLVGKRRPGAPPAGTGVELGAAAESGEEPRRGLPAPIKLAIAGAGAIVAIVAVAIAVRPPIVDETDAPPGFVPPTHATAGAPSSAPSVGLGPTAPAISDLGARELRPRFFKDVQTGRMKDGVDSLGRLLDVDPAAAEDRDVRNAIIDLSQRIMLLEDDTPDRMFALVASSMGTTGADILYELMTTKGGSRAAKRAEEILRDASVRERGTPGFRVAYELRMARKCEERIALFERAKTDADGRALGQLQLLNRSCSRSEECCLHNNPRLRETIDAIKARMK